MAPRKYLADDFSDEAVSFIERNHEKPFFLFLSYNAPHSPLQATPEYLARFPDIEDKKRKTYAAMVTSLDICATIAGLGGASIDSERPLDGVNLTPYLKGENTDPPHEGIFLRKFDSGMTAARSGDYKFVSFGKTGVTSVHNLAKDLGEKSNILEESPEEPVKLRGLWNDRNKDNIDPVFLGLIHTEKWKEKSGKTKGGKENSAARKGIK